MTKDTRSRHSINSMPEPIDDLGQPVTQDDERQPCVHETAGAEDRGPEPRTTASGQASCERCGRPLTGRKERFCSDACRMAVRREQQQHRRMDLLNAIGAAVEELRADLGCGDD